MVMSSVLCRRVGGRKAGDTAIFIDLQDTRVLPAIAAPCCLRCHPRHWRTEKKGPAEPAQVRRELKGLESVPFEPPGRCGNALSMGPKAPKPCDPICCQGLWPHADAMPCDTPPCFVFGTTAPARPEAMLRCSIPRRGRGIHARASLPIEVRVLDRVGTRLIATLSHTSLGADAGRLEVRHAQGSDCLSPLATEDDSSRNESSSLLAKYIANTVPEILTIV